MVCMESIPIETLIMMINRIDGMLAELNGMDTMMIEIAEGY